jgi:putative membrane protein
MMNKFSDNAANERTFLAWLRTGIAVIAFGFVIEKFNLFIAALTASNSEVSKSIRLDRVAGPLGRYEGFAMMVVGLILILLGYIRFSRGAKVIDSPSLSESPGIGAELWVTAVLMLLVSAYCVAILAR